MPKVPPQSAPFVPSKNQLLWKKDPRFQDLPKTKARDAVNVSIRELVIELVGKPPAGPYLPHHKDHPVSTPQIGVGHDNYKRIGSYHIIVSNLSSDSSLWVTQNAVVLARC